MGFMNHYRLIVDGDTKQYKSQVRYEPGEMIARLEQPYGAKKVELRLRVYPKYGTFELEAVDADGSRRLIAGGITSDGITVEDSPFEGS